MHWILASLLSALFLGVYELCTKHAVRENAVMPVLFFSTLTGAGVWFALLGVEAIHPGLLPASLVTDALTPFQHLQLALKSAIVAASWVFTYFAIKHLPLSLGSPIRSMNESVADFVRCNSDFGRAADSAGMSGGDDDDPFVHRTFICRQP